MGETDSDDGGFTPQVVEPVTANREKVEAGV
jgi:hypothetical protein